MHERSGIVTFKGSPLTLLGKEIKAGDKAPDFTVVDNGLNEKTLADYAGRPLIIASVPSLDTDVCDIETRRFSGEVAKLSDKVALLTISMDLPFAQKRWLDEAGADRVTALSDHRDASFGAAWGVLIKELRLLARAVFVVDASGAVTYVQMVGDITEEPDYDAALEALKAVA